MEKKLQKNIKGKEKRKKASASKWLIEVDRKTFMVLKFNSLSMSIIIVHSNNAFRSFQFRYMDFFFSFTFNCFLYTFFTIQWLLHISFFIYRAFVFVFRFLFFFFLVSCWSILFRFMWISFVEAVVLYSSIWIIVSHFHKNEEQCDEAVRTTIATTMMAMEAIATCGSYCSLIATVTILPLTSLMKPIILPAINVNFSIQKHIHNLFKRNSILRLTAKAQKKNKRPKIFVW